MKSPLVKTLLLVVVLGGLIGFYLWDKDRIEEEERQEEEAKELFAYDRDAVRNVTIQRPGLPALVLAKDGEDWTVREAPMGAGEVVPEGGLTARGDTSAINSMLGTLVNATKQRVIGSVTETARYGLELPGLTAIVSATDATDKTVIQFGNNAPEPRFAFASTRGSDEVYLLNKSVKQALDKRLFDLRNKSLMDSAPDTIQSVDLRTGGEIFSLARDAQGAWRIMAPYNNTLAEKDTVDAVLRQANSAKAKEFIDDATDLAQFGLVNAATEISLVGKDQAIRQLTVGAYSELAGGYYVKKPGSGTVMVAPKEFASNVFGKNIEEFRERNVLPFKYYNVEALDVTTTVRSYSLTKDEFEWHVRSPMDATAEYQGVSSRLQDLVGVEADRFVDAVTDAATFGFGDPQGTVTATNGEGQSSSYTFGRIISDGNEIFVRREQDGAVLVAPVDVWEAAISPVEQLLPEVEEPAPAETESATGAEPPLNIFEMDPGDATGAMPVTGEGG